MKKIYLLFLLALLPLLANAEGTGINGIYYNLNSWSETPTATVTQNPNKYSGDVVIPKSVTYNEVTYSVTAINSFAFSDCTDLISVTIPESVTSIGESAFNGCSSLTSVTIGKGVTSISGYAFTGCDALTSVHISDLAAWCKINFWFRYTNTTNPLALAHHLYMNGQEVKDLVIPDGVTEISNYAFYGCSEITSVTIPSSVTSIGSNVFTGCEALNAVKVTDIGAWCNISFNADNPLSVAQHLYLNDQEVVDLVIPEGTTSIGRHAFYSCKGIKSVKIPSSVTNIKYGAFAECESLTAVHVSDIGAFCNITFGDKEYGWGYNENPLNIAHHLYLNGEEVRDLVIPSNVISISDGLFSGCSELTSVKIEEGATSIGNSAFSDCTNIKTVEISNSVTEIGESAFSGCKAITTVSMGTGVNSIGSGAFSGCSGLVSITIPSGVKAINSSTFSGCTSLLSVTIPEGVETIGNSAFSRCNSLSKMTIPEGVTTIGERAFQSCQSITSLSLPKSLKSINYEAFYNIGQIKEVKLADLTAWCSITLDGYNSNPLALAEHVYVNDKEINDLVIPEGVTSISNGAFRNCRWITSLTIPNGFTTIGENAFAGCYGMKSVSIPNSVTTIDRYAFSGCNALESITIPSNVTSIGEYAFQRCYGLTSLIIPNGVTTINEFTFSECYALTSLSIPESVTTIKGNAFDGCSNLESLIIPSKVEYIYQQAFANCGNLKSVKSLAATPPFLYDNSFSNYEIPLYVPEGARDAYLAKEPWNKFKEILSGADTKYTLTYKVDDEVYSMYKLVEGAAIIPEEEPKKEGYEFSGWSTIPETMPAEDVTIKGTFTQILPYDLIIITSAGQTTWCSKYDLDFTNVEGIKAYIASGYHRTKGTIWLTRVKEVPAGEGILLIGDPGEYQVPHKTTTAYYANLMVGTIKAITINETDGDYTNYYLSNGTEGIGFYKVNGSVGIKANRAYLPLLKGTTQAGTRFIGFEYGDGEEGTTGISAALNDEGEMMNDKDVYYNLQGQRVENPGKGLYIRNGKKVVIK